MPRRKAHNTQKQGAELWQLFLAFLGTFLIIIAVAEHSHISRNGIFWLIIFGCLALAPMFWAELKVAERRRKTKGAEVELDKHIKTALRKMDALGGAFADEDSANQQLCILLRELMPGADVHLVKPGPRSMGDITVGNTIIEGKLDLLTKDELDRLIGQLQDYCSRSSSQIRVVVYGELRPDFSNRIKGLPDYYKRILLHHLEQPQKGRRRPGKGQWVVYRQRPSEDEETAPIKKERRCTELKRKETPLTRIYTLIFNPPGRKARESREKRGGLLFYNPIPKSRRKKNPRKN